MAVRQKKPEFKNPFDLDEEEDDETIPIHQQYGQVHQAQLHKPLPFNPYTMQDNPGQPVQHTEVAAPTVKKAVPQPKAFIPSEGVDGNGKTEVKVTEVNEDGDPPLLEDIGIDAQIIKERVLMVLKVAKPSEEVIDNPDLFGPIFIALCFGVLLLVSGKIQFGDIYAIFIVGNMLIYFLFNLISQVQIISLYNVMSTLGYSLLPMLVLGLFGIFLSLKGGPGIFLSLALAFWCSFAASNVMEAMMKQTEADRRPLLIYPLFLFYLSFAMIVIF